MRRRDFVALLGGAATVWPLAAYPQLTIPVIGFLSTASPEDLERFEVAFFRRGLKDAGYVEGQNIRFEIRGARADAARLPELAADLVRRGVTVIVSVGGSEAALAAKASTSTIPIIVAGGADPVKYGLVASLNRPGGNITGLTYLHNELAGKRLDLLREMAPEATRVGYITDTPANEVEHGVISDMLAAARALGREVTILECEKPDDFETAFASMAEHRVGALAVAAFPLALLNRSKILALAMRHKLPAIYPQSIYAYQGGLMSYASDAEVLRQAGIQYLVRILKGEKPADLPVQQPTKFDFIINLKTARALGLTVPVTLQVAATTVIE